jgi:thiol-disulfide isomerase/thioredoxin
VDDLLLLSVSLLWAVALIDLVLTLRVTRWITARNEERLRYVAGIPQLQLDAPAPAFQARTLDGEPVRLGDFAGRRLALMFMSPSCGPCRAELPVLMQLAPMARAAEGVEMLIVSDAGVAETREWINSVRVEDSIEVDLPVLVAAQDSTFLHEYNPNADVPYFCLIDQEGLVRRRSLLVELEWQHVAQRWASWQTAEDGKSAAHA